MDKLLAMRTFVQVVEAGTFTRGADLLQLPKSTVTRMVQALEKDVGAKLLHRTTRQLTMTEEGALYYDGAVRLLAQVAELDTSVAGAGAAPRGRIRVEAAGAVAYNILIPALPGFFERYPQVQVELGVGNRSIDLIAENVDCVVRLGDLVSDALIARPLGNLTLVSCASKAYLARHGTPVDPADLAQGHTLVQIVAPRTGRAFTDALSRDGQTVTLQASHRLAVNDSTAALLAAVEGLGIVTTYAFLAQPHIERGVLQSLFPDWQAEVVQAHVAYPVNRHLPAKVRVFIDWVTAHFMRNKIAWGRGGLA
jgi:LysR family transcriptional regulator, regulator for bpeEF and oprC